MRLAPVFSALAPATDGVEFFANRVGGWPNYRVARDRFGHAALLIAFSGKPSQEPGGQVDLKYVSFWPDVNCVIATDDAVDSGRFAIVRWKTDDVRLQDLFLELLGNWIETLGQTPDPDTLRLGFDRLAHVFEALALPGTSEVVGIWGELFLLACATAPERAVLAWHSEPRELYDFQAGVDRLEVKTSTSGLRRHDFSLQQLSPPEGSRLVIASLLLTSRGRTLSVPELVAVLKDRLVSVDLKLRVDAVVAATLGQSYSDISGLRFNPSDALAALRFFEGRLVPCVPREIPAEVSEVRFKSELDGLPHMSREALSSSPFLSALCPDSRAHSWEWST